MPETKKASDVSQIDLAPIFAAIEKIIHRLDKLESAPAQREGKTALTFHPSLEKFGVAEAIADAIFEGVSKEKACSFEPNGKPCDHCAMCNSRGF